jgi:hypothetical protein
VEGPFAAGQALDDQLGALVDEDRHQMTGFGVIRVCGVVGSVI